MLIAVGIIIFLSAGQLALKDTNQDLLKERLSRLESLRQQLGIVEGKIELMEKEYVDEVTGEGGSRRFGQGPVATQKQQMVEEQKRRKEEMNEEVKRLNKEIENMQNSVSQIRPSETQIPIIISTMATRIGTIVLLLFLVQILVPLYRYNTKLASYYDARADALTLIDLSNDTDLEKLTSIISPDTLDFSKPPASPTQQAIELAKEILTSQRPKAE